MNTVMFQENEIISALASERCEFQEKLGQGEFGIVVRAVDNVTQRCFAVKMMPVLVGDSENKPPRCQACQRKYHERELELLKKVSHRNLVEYIHDWRVKIANKEIICIQMELCWLDLCNYISMRGPSIAKDKSRIFPQILNGLGAIHSLGWIHRDIHLNNILLANPSPSKVQDIVVKIADFGLARPINDVGPSLNATKVSILGKLSSRNVEHELFGAPELSTEDYDYKVDLYSAGVVLYILCCYLRHRQHREWQVEIEQFRAGSLNITHLCHGDETLVQLLRDLLSKKPSVRPSAQAAVERYSRTADFRNMYTTPLKSSATFLAKGDISALRAE